MGNPVACLFYKKEEKMRKKLAKVFSFKKKNSIKEINICQIVGGLCTGGLVGDKDGTLTRQDGGRGGQLLSQVERLLVGRGQRRTASVSGREVACRTGAEEDNFCLR